MAIRSPFREEKIMTMDKLKETKSYVPTTNPCKVCAPLGASLAVKGVEKGMGILHGSQGCSTYIRRYMISHFKEPLDIASSSFDEASAVFGGKDNLKAAILNVDRNYSPKLITLSTTCLSETIGDDVKAYCREFSGLTEAELIPVPTPSFAGAHLDGYYAAVHGIVKHKKRLESAGETSEKTGKKKNRQKINIFPSIYSPADIRHLKEIVSAFDLRAMVLPDYSATLDGEIWGEYIPISPGGTLLDDIAAAHLAEASISFSPYLPEERSAAAFLETSDGVTHHKLRPPFGIRGTDVFMSTLLSAKAVDEEGAVRFDLPQEFQEQRARLIDAYVDCHKYLFGKRAAVFGDADFVAGMAAFLDEIGVQPVICACGSPFGDFEPYLLDGLENTAPEFIGDDIDFKNLEEILSSIGADILIGNSKGYPISRKLNIPLIRAGFPIHDRVGGPRILHIGYSGAMNLLDKIVNTLLERRQVDSTVGYSYL
jgi:nitrogenase molybdenum-iron protein NifN